MAHKLLADLLDDAAPAAELFDRGHLGQPDPRTARLLADALEPAPDDTESIRSCREVVFHWLWQTTQQPDG